jgi:hypothetical protein
MPDGKPPICGLLVSALSRPVESSISDVQFDFGWRDRDTLDVLAHLDSVLIAWDLECIPKLGTLGLDDLRVFRRRNIEGENNVVRNEILQGEGQDIEFKESLVLDSKKLLQGGQPLKNCFSEEVLFSSLKTVAAFLNTSGGSLLLGIGDDGAIVGIDRELSLIPGSRKYDFDEWELFFRSKIEGTFVNGRSINASLLVSRTIFEGHTVVRVQVGPRKDLAILKFGGRDHLFIRSGNRTLSLQFSDLQAFFELRKVYL